MRRAAMSSLESVFGVLGVVVALALVMLPVRAHAQDDAPGLAAPARFVATLSSGVPLRLTLHDDLGQERLAPAFVDALVGFVPESGARVRLGAALGVSSNLAADGGYAEPVYAGEQLVLMPAVLAHLELAHDVPLYPHLGLPILLGVAGHTFGLELGGAIAYRLLAGVAAFVELDVATFVGARAALDVLASLELGVAIEYEVLP